MTPKQIFNLIIISLLIILFSTTIYLFRNNSKQKYNIEYLNKNLQVKDTKISEMTFSTKELNSFIKNKDTKQKIEIDSILKLQDIKIKNLIKYQKITSVIVDKDTTEVIFNEVKKYNDSTYKKEFQVEKKCIKIEGYILSKDNNSKVIVTKTESDNTVYITTSYIKSFWDKVLFRKGKEVTKIINKCGESTIDEIKIKKE